MTGSDVPGCADSPKQVVMLSGDLLFVSKVKMAAVTAGAEFSFGKKLPEDLDAAVGWVLVDLSGHNGSLDEVVQRCREGCPDARLIAYGPHVQVAKLKAAREAGIETVLTNGQLDAGLGNLFRA